MRHTLCVRAGRWSCCVALMGVYFLIMHRGPRLRLPLEKGVAMVILDEPYASPQLLEWLESSQHPVLRNAFSERTAFASGRALHLVDEAEAASRLFAGERVYTNSENTLEWICSHADNPSLTHAITVFKDKVAMRELLAQMDEDGDDGGHPVLMT